jgi:hypothetical protein
MKSSLSWLLLLLLLTSVSAFAQNAAAPQTSPGVLRNHDVLLMVQEGVSANEIISRIARSPCEFDIFPPVIHDLQERGVPDAVLAKMTSVPYGPAAGRAAGSEKSEVVVRRAVKIPVGTVISVEAQKNVSSADVDKGSPITFLVSRRVVVNGAVAISHGAAVNGRIIKRSRPSFFGRGGSLEFELDDVVAVDGTSVPVELSKGGVKGSNHTSAIAAGAIITGAIVFPYTAPVGLIWGLKKGDEAVLEQGTRLKVIVKKNQEIAGLPTERKPIYHPVNNVKQPAVQSTGFKGTGNRSARPTSIKH